MLDNYIQGFEEARQFIQHHYDALPMPMQNNPNRFKHGNRCPQGEYLGTATGQKRILSGDWQEKRRNE